MPKYFSEKNKYVVDEPSLLTINGSVDIQYAGGTEHKDGEFTIQVGNIESYNPTKIEQEPLSDPNPTPTEPGESGGGSEQGGESGEGNDPVTPTPSGNSVGFILVNECGKEVRLSGRVTLNISQTPTNWDTSTQVSANINGPTNGESWSKNTVSINAGESYSWTASVDSRYTNGNYYFVSTDKPEISLYSIYLYTRTYRRSKNKTEGSTGIYTVTPLQSTKLLNGGTYVLRITNMYEDATLDPNDTTKGYVVLPIGKEKL